MLLKTPEFAMISQKKFKAFLVFFPFDSVGKLIFKKIRYVALKGARKRVFQRNPFSSEFSEISTSKKQRNVTQAQSEIAPFIFLLLKIDVVK